MFLVLPIRTASVSRTPPLANYALIAVNAIVFLLTLLFQPSSRGDNTIASIKELLYFHSFAPQLHQFVTYQFLHADAWHLFGNMLFLWVFGNSVNGKMGHLPYLLFYLSCGIFAAWGYAVTNPQNFQLVGASGAVAGITTAYLALFPRCRVTTLLWLFLFIHFFELPAMLIIGLKIIVWDNILAPQFSPGGSTAHGAHLAGYFFGFAASLMMLAVRALPRDQFDILALWKRWNQRRELSAALAVPGASAVARYGSVARVKPLTPQQQAEQEKQLDEMTALRGQISERIDTGDTPGAATLYEQLVLKDPRQCLPERQQLTIAREFYASGRFPQAALAFDRFAESYQRSPELANVKLLLGIVYARDLAQYEPADKHLSEVLDTLRDEGRRTQCLDWLQRVRTALGRPGPER